MRGKCPSLISGCNGQPDITKCKRKSSCVRCKNEILKDSMCVDIPFADSGFTNNRRYCISCFQAILAQTRKELDRLETSLHALD